MPVRLLLVGIALLFQGCVHEISTAPALDTIKNRNIHYRTDRRVAYYIPKAQYAEKFVTEGGDGHSVTYAPYKETEAALRKVLSSLFTSVSRLDTMDEKSVAEKKIDYVFVPTIKTYSASASNVDWEPTHFVMSISCQTLDSGLKEVWKTEVIGKGRANFAQLERNPSLSAQKASKFAYLNLQKEMLKARSVFE
jgi:hypothetical protein